MDGGSRLRRNLRPPGRRRKPTESPCYRFFTLLQKIRGRERQLQRAVPWHRVPRSVGALRVTGPYGIPNPRRRKLGASPGEGRLLRAASPSVRGEPRAEGEADG